ncbi:MAG: hypothetical protein IPL39_09205 [Opitutaceae bacterium]|nr:hypothetical protein [Opitutaceae bacterium]
MGLTRQIARAMLREHRFQPITGRVLTIGRQTIYLTPEELLKLLDEEGIAPRPDSPLTLDTQTVHGKGRGFVTDVAFFQSFADVTCDSVDVSDYEGATVLANLNSEIPDPLRGRYDFIYNGSCLDNIFDGANALRRMNEMLSPTGRIVHFERCSYFPAVYLSYSPEWFYDYYAANNFADCHAYYVLRPGAGAMTSNNESWELFRYFPGDSIPSPVHACGQEPWGIPINLHTFVIAERREDSTTGVFPIQRCYRSPDRTGCPASSIQCLSSAGVWIGDHSVHSRVLAPCRVSVGITVGLFATNN